MNLHVRPAVFEDIPRMLQLRDAGRAIMLQSGNLHQWAEGHPTEATLRADIEKGQSFLVVDGTQIVGMFACVDGPDPTYLNIYEGQWLDDTRPYKVIHRVASTPDSHGVFDALIRFTATQTDNIRIDTHRDNAIMQRLILRNGFTYCGIIYLLNGDERLAYQRLQLK